MPTTWPSPSDPAHMTCPRTQKRPWRPGTRTPQRRRGGLAHRASGLDHARPQRAGGPGHRRDDVLLLPPLLRAAHVLECHLVPLPPARARGDADGDLVADPVTRRARSTGPPTPPEAWESFDDERCRPSPPRTSPTCRASRRASKQGLRVHAPVGGLEGGIANFERTLDGFFAGRPTRSCSRPCGRSTSIRSSGPWSTSEF